MTSGTKSRREGCRLVARSHRVVVIGGGFSGTLLTLQLLLRSKIPLCITIIDRSSLPGRGVAYATSRIEHLLNVKAGEMSALADDPGHFARWLEAAGTKVGPNDFAPRQIYGEYLAALFDQVCASCDRSSVSWITGHAVSLRPEEGIAKVGLDDGQTLDGDVVVLATGNAPPALPRQIAHLDEKFVVRYAWIEGALDGIPGFGSVLILGSGLTAVDQVLALRAQGFKGKITLLSRRGKLPAVHHAGYGSWSSHWTKGLPISLRLITSRLRKEVRLAEFQGVDWRAVVDSMRPAAARTWQSLSPKDRKQFLRHLRSYWEIARHRISPQSSAVLQDAVQSGQLSIVAGTLLSAEQSDEHVTVSYRERGKDITSTLQVNLIINCIGPGFVPRSQDALIERMLHDQLARLDTVGLGIETSADGALISGFGATMDAVYAIGPVRKASLWETTAVREIRLQALELADLILEKFDHHLSRLQSRDAEQLEMHP